MTYVGGLRARLIKESIFQTVHDSLDALGWFDTGRKHTPITFSDTTVPDSDSVQKNTLVLNDWDASELEGEMGSLFTEFRSIYYLDFYAESDAIGVHMSQDLKDILAGRMSSIGRSSPTISVVDYTIATPAEIFVVQIENIFVDRPEVFTFQWQRHQRSVRFEVVDNYTDDSE